MQVQVYTSDSCLISNLGQANFKWLRLNFVKSNFAGSEGEGQASTATAFTMSITLSESQTADDVSAFYDKMENVMGYSCLKVDGDGESERERERERERENSEKVAFEVD